MGSATSDIAFVTCGDWDCKHVGHSPANKLGITVAVVNSYC